MCVWEGKSKRRNISSPEFGSEGDVGRLCESVCELGAGCGTKRENSKKKTRGR